MLDHLDLHLLREREDHAATQGFAGGLALGILLGVVLTLVFAPRRGDETRSAVAQAAHDVKERTTHLVTRGAPPDDETDFGDAAAIEREIGSSTTGTTTS
ncbi:MAG: YtxH domain-containing protein [Chloroflexota bacterium]|nr:YtxH domain-containing protein [Chloroflexota bacterium]